MLCLLAWPFRKSATGLCVPAQQDWDDIRVFLAVARHGSLSGAARALGLNHTTVLRRIAHYEEGLGVRLFEKLPTGYALTAAGEDMLVSAQRIDEEVANLDRRLSGRDTQISGTLRVTTVDIMALHVLPRHLADFRAAFPKVVLDIVIAETSFSLTRREADVAIRSTSKPPEALVGRTVAGLAFAIYGAGSYLAQRPADDDLAAHDWVGLDESFDQRPMGRWLNREIPAERVGIRLNSVAAEIEAVRAGIGLAVLPCAVADTMPELVRLRPPLSDVSSQIWLLTHADLRRMARVRAFLDFIGERLRRERDLLEGRRPAVTAT